MSEPFSQKFLFSSPNTQERKNLSLSLSTSAVFSRDATEKNGRRPQRWRDVRDSRPLFFPLFARSVSSLSLSLSLCSRGILYAVSRDFFCALFSLARLGGAWCRATREGRKRKNKGVAKARLDANRWNRAQKNAARVVFERRGARRRVGRRARPRPRSRDLDFWFWVGHLIPRGSSPCVRAC